MQRASSSNLECGREHQRGTCSLAFLSCMRLLPKKVGIVTRAIPMSEPLINRYSKLHRPVSTAGENLTSRFAGTTSVSTCTRPAAEPNTGHAAEKALSRQHVRYESVAISTIGSSLTLASHSTPQPKGREQGKSCLNQIEMLHLTNLIAAW